MHFSKIVVHSALAASAFAAPLSATINVGSDVNSLEGTTQGAVSDAEGAAGVSDTLSGVNSIVERLVVLEATATSTAAGSTSATSVGVSPGTTTVHGVSHAKVTEEAKRRLHGLVVKYIEHRVVVDATVTSAAAGSTSATSVGVSPGTTTVHGVSHAKVTEEAKL